MVVERNAVAIAAIFEIRRLVAFGTVNLAGTFPAIGDLELIVIQTVMHHRLQQHFSVEGLVVRNNRAPKKPFVDLREMAVESFFAFGIRRIDAMHPNIVVRKMVVRRLDQRVIFICDDAVVNGDNPHGARTLWMCCCGFKIDRGKIHKLVLAAKIRKEFNARWRTFTKNTI